MNIPENPLKLENQLCFPIYAVSRLITKEYQPLLNELGITYPQYLVLLVLWEYKSMPVNSIARKLLLNTNTITPLLKRMEAEGWIIRRKDSQDERKVWIDLSPKGIQTQKQAECIPSMLIQNVISKNKPETELSSDEILQFKSTLDKLLILLSD